MSEPPSNADSWDKVAGSWDKLFGPVYDRGEMIWGPYGPTEREAGLLPELKGARVLVPGCGAGGDVAWVTKAGAEVIGFDISPRQLKLAEKRLSEADLKAILQEHDLNALKPDDYDPESFDVVLSSYGLQYAEGFSRLSELFYGWLKPGGTLVFSHDHPIYIALGKTPDRQLTRELGDYLNDQQRRSTIPADDGSKPEIGYYQRSIESIFHSLRDAGFMVDRVLEPKPTMRSDWKNQETFALAHEIPTTVIFKAVKPA